MLGHPGWLRASGERCLEVSPMFCIDNDGPEKNGCRVYREVYPKKEYLGKGTKSGIFGAQ